MSLATIDSCLPKHKNSVLVIDYYCYEPSAHNMPKIYIVRHMRHLYLCSTIVLC
jgi:hypothetical protein